ncbi:helix-hairpin-helix domain-containing protein [Sulfuricurvum sp.]|uniref:ComEA family DNA-binding protein n=1 Tax=Sulfuricurvum sp. TaxID=2025608 RepID=UPI00261B841F|nr:helix-hairpin-helix domain-containing protein [Sulfuricurvum sp.]MDD4950623.1 helix-hairpin-helix domain-containing protein [Sulfuricurvum sp.]
MVKIIFLVMFIFSSLFAVVNVNSANSAQLQTLNGIGPTKAGEILKYRKAHGGFKSVDELVNVKGIGPKTLQHIKSQVSIR